MPIPGPYTPGFPPFPVAPPSQDAWQRMGPPAPPVYSPPPAYQPPNQGAGGGQPNYGGEQGYYYPNPGDMDGYGNRFMPATGKFEPPNMFSDLNPDYGWESPGGGGGGGGGWGGPGGGGGGEWQPRRPV